MPESASILAQKFRRVSRQIPYLPRALGFVWEAAGAWTAGWIAVLILQGLLPVAIVYLTRQLVNALVAAVRVHGENGSLQPVIVAAFLMAAVLVADALLRSLATWLRAAQADLVQDHISRLIQSKSAAVDLAFYESADFYDHLHRARAEGASRPVTLIENLGSLLQNGITLTAMLGVLAPFGVWLPLALAVGTVPALYVVLRFAVLRHRFQLRATPAERRGWYYDWVLTSSEFAAELRLFGLAGYFEARFADVRRTLREEHCSLAAAQAWAELAAGSAALLVAGGAGAWMAWRAIRGLVTLGDLALFYQAFQQGLRLMQSLLENTGQIFQNSLFLGNLFEFLALAPAVVDPAAPVPVPGALHEGVRFRGVGFGYPASRGKLFDGLDLFLPAGQIVAIVGPNGAGKSTLVKLLCRLYDPDTGSIELDGRDLRTMALEEIRGNMAVLFQQPAHYNASVADNIAMGDLRQRDKRARIEQAARAAGADTLVEKLPQGYEQLLGNWFESGTELSGGEWRRIALARAFLRQAPLVIFDEPTSAMDPWAEAEWLGRFRTLAAGRTVLMITHRFSTTRLADVIHVMVEGRILESGSHAELLAKGGLYAQGWNSRG